MKKFSLVIVMLLFTVSAFAQSVRIGFFEVAPLVFTDQGSNVPKGAIVEFLEEKIAPAMGVTFVWSKEAISIPRQLEMLKTDKLDAAAVFAKNPEREKFLDFPAEPFIKTNPVLAVLKENPLQKITSVDDVLGLTIGHCAKSFISPFMRDERIKWDFLSSNNCIAQNLKKLVAKRFDAQYQPDVPPLLYYARETGVEDAIKLIPLPEQTNVYSPFSKAAGAIYLKKYEQAFEQVGGRDAFLKYLAKYIDITRL